MQNTRKTREEIERVLQNHNTNVLNFPDRGPWGDSGWRGNCSGWVQALMIYKYSVQKFAELFAGSGTGSDVCRDMGVPYIGADLNPNPVRHNILSVNAITDEVPTEFLDADFLFMHPPYPMINIPYAGSMYADPKGDLAKSDIGQMNWEKGMRVLNEVIMKYYSAMKSNSKMGILVGEVRRNGQYYSMMNDMVKPGRTEQMFVKLQNNCMSTGKTYNRKVTLTMYEMMIVIEKMSEFFFSYMLPTKHELDARDSLSITWRNLLVSVMRNSGKTEIHEKELTDIIRNHKKAQNNKNPDAKVRQTLQINPEFIRVRPGVYKLDLSYRKAAA